MKINVVPTVISLALSALLAYGLSVLNEPVNKILLTAGSFIFLATTLTSTIGLHFDLPRTKTNIRAVSAIFFVVALISNLFFSFINFTTPIYIIVNGILFLIFLLLTYSIAKAKQ